MKVWLALVLLGALASRQAMADERLFNFGKEFDFAKVQSTDAKVTESKSAAGGAAIAVATGHKDPWPGIILAAPSGAWDLSKFDYVALDVKNTGTSAVAVNCRVDNAGADGTNNCCTDRINLKAGETGTLKVLLRRRPAGPAGIKLFGMRGYPVSQDTKGTIDPSKVTQLVVFIAKPTEDHQFEIDNVRAAGAYAPPPETKIDPARFFPFIDQFGQYMHRDWPGKTRAITDMDDLKKEETAGLKAKTGPKNWDQYGGWQDGPALQATGFFRTDKRDGRWWLVDPDGRLFWSHGIDCVNESGLTPIEDRENWFADLPFKRPDFQAFFQTVQSTHGYYTGRRPKCFDFSRANALRKYGPNWQQATADIAHKRLRSWGMNTIGNWSDPAIYLMRKTPYVATIWFSARPIRGSQGYWGQFKDPFDPEFAANLRARVAAEAGKSAGDPWCLGYFVDNEMGWGDDTSLAVAALASPADQAAKKAFIEDLRAKYGTIEKLSAAWGTGHASWDALLASTAPPDKARAGDDLRAFYTRIAEQYFRTVRDAVKQVAPNQLYLGCRFAWVNDRAAAAAARFCDVVSYNRYTRSVAELRLPAGAEDKPLIIGEFHFGALDRGMFHTGLVPVADQAARAEAYRAYVRGALANPLMVGTHWFKYQDEPTTGRPLDEENYQIGFIDICDTPYPETIAASREVGNEMYRLRSAK